METGTPDIYVAPNCWIEAKTIHYSDRDDKERTKRLLQTSKAHLGGVSSPRPGLSTKFESALADAKKKFERQESGRYVIFFNLTGLDWPQLSVADEALAELGRWADQRAQREAGIGIVMCYNYD